METTKLGWPLQRRRRQYVGVLCHLILIETAVYPQMDIYFLTSDKFDAQKDPIHGHQAFFHLKVPESCLNYLNLFLKWDDCKQAGEVNILPPWSKV